MLNQLIENHAESILDELGVYELPIPVEKIAKNRGLNVLAYDLGEDVSGLLVMDNGTNTIGYNAAHSKVRQRFTIAHELGHFELHKAPTGIFIDNKSFKVEFRNRDSSTGEYQKEQEANAFAAALLMPKRLLVEQIEQTELHLNDESSIAFLAKLFNVSAIAMTYRIANLQLNWEY